jgi:hypothetical protein
MTSLGQVVGSLALTASLALSPNPALVPTEGLVRGDVDAATYARMTGVTLSEAQRRLALQESIGDLGEVLEQQEGDTFAGLYIDHVPEYRLVVQFTRDGAETIRPYVRGQPFEPIVRVEVAEYTWSQLLQDIRGIRSELGVGTYALDVDVPTNRVLVEVLSTTDLDRMGGDAWEPPKSADVVIVDSLPEPALDLYGGLALSDCTSGFSIYKGSNISNRAITTAGHCSNSQSYSGNTLVYQNDERITGSYDSQSHKRSGASYPNRVYDAQGYPYYRTITAKRDRVYQDVGDFVCHYGKVTGYGCGYIVSKIATPCGGGGAEYNTAIKVDSDPDGEGFDLAQGGDSGGPWFIGNTALGTTSCQQGYDAIYVATNYVEAALGATILTSP